MIKKDIEFFKSINIINIIMLILIFTVNSYFYINTNIEKYVSLFVGINILLFMIFLSVNRFFQVEYRLSNDDFKKLNETVLWWMNKEIKEILLRKTFFKENEENYKIFRNMYIKKNLIAKDYNDLKKIFLKFIPESFIKEIWIKWTEKIWLWITVKKHLNVMFLDIIWFTSIAEKLSPNKVLLLLNIYFDGIVEIVKSNWWYIDKFLWDWMMVIFEDKRSDNIIKTAIEIQEFMNKFKISNIWKKINIWIWINSGDVIMWTVGSSERMEITIIWDVVNTASKIEWLTRLFGNKILISGNTYKLIQNKDLYNITNLWKQEIKWREHKIKLFWIES